jgi:hypothetical protein
MDIRAQIRSLNIGDRVRFLGGDGPHNFGVLISLLPNETWDHSALVRWDSGEVAGIARAFDLNREWRCALT